MDTRSGLERLRLTDLVRRIFLGYGATVSGMAVVFSLLAFIPGVGSFPAPFFIPFLPVLAVGLLYWFGEGRYRDSIAVWLILGTMIVGLLLVSELSLAMYGLFSVLCMIALSALIVDMRDWILACRGFLLGYFFSLILLTSVWLDASRFRFVALDRFMSLRSLTNETVIDPNHFAFHSGFALLISVSLLNSERGNAKPRIDRVIVTAGIVVSILSLALTQSRGGLLATLGAIAVMVLFGVAIGRWRTWVALGVGLLAASGFLIITRPSIVDRFLSDDGTGGGRTTMWRSAYDVIVTDVPTLLFGAGTMQGASAFWANNAKNHDFLLAGVRTTIDYVGQSGRTGVHNSYISWILDYGLVGALVAVIAITLVSLRALRIDQGRMLAFGLGLIAYYMLVSVFYIAYELYAVSIACGGLTLGYIYFRRHEVGMMRPPSES